MNYAKIKYNDIANGDGIRTSLFVSGCEFHCNGCFNADTWDFEYGDTFTRMTIKDIVASLDNPNIQGLSILGGEPLHPDNIEWIYYLVMNVRMHFDEEKDIWIWTGYEWEELCERISNSKWQNRYYTKEILQATDVITVGRFDRNKKDLKRQYSGSSNQQTLYCRKTLKNSKSPYFEENRHPIKEYIIEEKED